MRMKVGSVVLLAMGIDCFTKESHVKTGMSSFYSTLTAHRNTGNGMAE
jgi:hypothetical protein